MPFLMIRNDITRVEADAIVNPANPALLQGSGTSRAIYQAAGEAELTAACKAIGHCDPGKAVCTPAFRLPAKYIFHAVCPAWRGGTAGEAQQLAGAYRSALELAAEYHCGSVAALPAKHSSWPGPTAPHWNWLRSITAGAWRHRCFPPETTAIRKNRRSALRWMSSLGLCWNMT